MSVVLKNICLSEEAAKVVEAKMNEGTFNFSSWVSEQVLATFKDIAALEREAADLTKRLVEVNSRIEIIKKYSVASKQVNAFTDKEIFWFREAKKIIEARPGVLDGRINLYKNEFGRHITKVDFLRRMEQATGS